MNVLLLLAALVPQQVLIVSARGQTSIPVSNERGAAAVAAILLAQPLGLATSLDGSAISVTLDGRAFDFELDSPFMRYGGIAYPLVSALERVIRSGTTPQRSQQNIRPVRPKPLITSSAINNTP